ncbi:MAG: hypothetical protein KC621_21310 [Myxococcales bacterium]|nr:hypothetical protein [Myxococcales bacterium]
MLSFDNMQERPIRGTQDWTRHEIVLDVPTGATNIAFGILVAGKGTVWIDRGAESVAFDNMQDRALGGTQPWARHSVVLDVPKDATALVYGALLSGRGRVWVDDVRLEVVDRTVPVTDLKAKRLEGPANLDFEL